ncbi:MAG: hypothetical protein J0L75_06955 [Spirochaetes bacterium]|nr:hypothetical protein [Spirochaetota bacterium]
MKPTQFDLERLARGENPTRPIDGADHREAVAGLKRSDAEILGRYPVEAMRETVLKRLSAAKIEDGARRARLRRLRVGLFAAPLLAAAAFVLAFVVVPSRKPTIAALHDEGSGEIRVKGLTSHLVVYRRTPSGVERLLPGGQASPGEQLQVAFVRESNDRYGIILSIDGRGVTTWHFPEAPSTLATFTTGLGEVLLPKSYVLDDAPSFERFFFLTSSRPFDAAAVHAAVENLARLQGGAVSREPALPPGVQMSSFLVRKP